MQEQKCNLLSQLMKVCDEDQQVIDHYMQTLDEEKLLDLWLKIQEHYDDPLLELMSIFAQHAFTEAFLRNCCPSSISTTAATTTIH